MLNISLCPRCARFNHSAKKCTNQPKCAFCAGDHPSKECKSNKFSCANCLYANKNYGQSYNTDHCANDTKSCEILKKKITICISNTEYSRKPGISNFIGPKPPSSDTKNDHDNSTQSTSAGAAGTTNVQVPIAAVSQEQIKSKIKSTIITRNKASQKPS